MRKSEDAGSCKSCNKPFIDHLGILGTCAQLQLCRATFQEILGRLDVKSSQHDLMLYKLIEDVLDQTKD